MSEIHITVVQKGATNGWTEGIVGDIPSLCEDQEIKKGCMIMFRLRSQDTEAGRVDVIMGDTADENEFLHRVFVGNITKFVLITKPAQQNKKTYFPCHATTSKGVCSW
jgi:hypothetical protein